MTSLPASARGSSPPLTDRVPGQAVMSQALDIAGGDPARSWFGRLFGASPLSDESFPWFQGALGEIRVGRLLADLGPEWTVLHAVPVGTKGSDIDHVLIGPAGVFVQPKELTVKQSPAGVVVRTDRSLLRWLRRRRPVLSDGRVTRITAAAVQPGTWHRNPAPPEVEPAVLQERFAALRASVFAARRRRRLWAFGLLGSAAAMAVSQGPDILAGLAGAVLS